MVYLIALVILVCSHAMAQTTNEELARLHEHLGMPPSVSLGVAESSALTSKMPMKVYIATGLDIGVRGNFKEWISKWNRKEGKKYGALQVVPDLSTADVILSRYTLRDEVTTGTNTDITNRSVHEWPSGRIARVPVPKTYSYNQVPVYAYVIEKKSESYEILWRYASSTSVEERRDSGKQLWEDFQHMIKARGKVR